VSTAERVWKEATHGDYWFVSEASDDEGEAEREREFAFFIYEIPLHEGDPAGDDYEEPVGYAYVVCNGLAEDSISRQFSSLEEAQLGAEEWFKQTRLAKGESR